MKKTIIVWCLFLFVASTGFGQWCQTFVKNISNTSYDCTTISTNFRFMNNGIFSWKNKPFYITSTGNDLVVYDINGSYAANPRRVTGSAFHVPNQGDSDYDLLNFSVCDECQYGTANFKLGLVIFSFIGNVNPVFSIHARFPEASSAHSSPVFKFNEKTYMLSNGLSDGCSDGTAGLYLITNDGIETIPQRIACVHKINGSTLSVYSGLRISENILWVTDQNNVINAFSITGNDVSVSLSPVQMPVSIRAASGSGMSVDRDENLVVTAAYPFPNYGVKVWDITNPVQPQLVWSKSDARVNIASIKYPFIFTARNGSVYDTHVWDITDVSDTVELDINNNGFWNLTNQWNAYPCQWDYSGVLHPEQKYLYFVRYSVDQVYNLSQCVSTPTPTPLPTPTPTPIPTPTPTHVIFQDGFESGDTSAW